MVVHSSSVQVIAHYNLSQVPHLLMGVGKWLEVMLAAKWSACVAPKMDLGECRSTLHPPLQKSKFGRTHSGFKTQRWCHRKSKTGVPVAPKKDMCSPKTFKKKKRYHNITTIFPLCLTWSGFAGMDGRTQVDIAKECNRNSREAANCLAGKDN